MAYVSCNCHNGECPSCCGTGKAAFSKINQGFGSGPLYCRTCNGTKQCQKCGGTSKVWKNEPKTYEKREKKGGKRSTSYSGSSYSYSGGSGGSDVPWWVFIIGFGIVAFVVLSIISSFWNSINRDLNKMAEYNQQAPQREVARQRVEAEHAERKRHDLPAGLNVGDTNYIETGTSTIGPHVVFNEPPAPGIQFHVYTRHPGTDWVEQEQEGFFVQDMGDGTYRVIINTVHILSTMGGGRIIIAWE